MKCRGDVIYLTEIGTFIARRITVELAEACAHAVMKSGIDLAVSYCMQ
ncbi:hypothetical protein GLO35_22385, partial [Escherichia coli]|nr:hypothetical protein [Escherichia coli]MDZ4987970.1 hypothetical protein [Escherichia coli]